MAFERWSGLCDLMAKTCLMFIVRVGASAVRLSGRAPGAAAVFMRIGDTSLALSPRPVVSFMRHKRQIDWIRDGERCFLFLWCCDGEDGGNIPLREKERPFRRPPKFDIYKAIQGGSAEKRIAFCRSNVESFSPFQSVLITG